jgi:hypothetical protein
MKFNSNADDYSLHKMRDINRLSPDFTRWLRDQMHAIKQTQRLAARRERMEKVGLM